MPYRTQYRRRYPSRRRYTRPRTSYRPKSRMTRKRTYRKPRLTKWVNPVKRNTELMKLTFQDTNFTAAMTTATAYLYNYTFRLNSIYDPDFTGVGVQPYGYDQLFGPDNFYGNYVVYGSKITIIPYYTGNDAGNAIRGTVITVFPFNSANCTYDEVNDIANIPYKKQLCLRSLDDLSRARKITNYMSFKKLTGKDPNNNICQYNTNPTDAAFWVVKMNNSAAALDLTIKYDVRITYYLKAIKTDDINES